MHWPDFRTAIVADIVLCPDTRLGEYRAALVLYAKKRLSADVIEVIRDHWDCVNWDIVNPPIEEFRRTMPKAHELDPERDQSLLIWDPHGC